MMDSSDLKEYNKIQTNRRVYVHLDTMESTLLAEDMEAEGWAGASPYIKYKLFGSRMEKKYRDRIRNGKQEDLVITLREAVLGMADKLEYINYLYNKKTKQLYREEGVDMKKWIKVTEQMHQKTLNAALESLKICQQVAKALKLEEFFDLPSQHMPVSQEDTKEYKDKVSAQMRKERIAMGYWPDD